MAQGAPAASPSRPEGEFRGCNLSFALGTHTAPVKPSVVVGRTAEEEAAEGAWGVFQWWLPRSTGGFWFPGLILRKVPPSVAVSAVAARVHVLVGSGGG